MPRSLPALATFALLALPFTATGAWAGETRITALAGLERTDAAPGSGAADGFYAGVQLGHDFDLGAVLVGVEGELGESTAASDLAGGRAEQGLFASGAVRVALPIGPGTRVFARGGVAYHRIENTVGPDFSGTGFTTGAGLEQDLGNRLLLRGEYRFSDYGSQVRGQHFLFGLGLRF